MHHNEVVGALNKTTEDLLTLNHELKKVIPTIQDTYINICHDLNENFIIKDKMPMYLRIDLETIFNVKISDPDFKLVMPL